MKSRKPDRKLIASVSVLRALYDERRDIYDVLVEFINRTIANRSLSAFSSTECVQYLEEDFGLSLPEVIVKSCLRKRLVKAGTLKLEYGKYSVLIKITHSTEFQSDFEQARSDYDEIINKIQDFCNKNEISGAEKEDIEKSLESYLIRPDKNDRLSYEIAKFIVKFEKEPGFKDKLNKIEEGLIIYTGIRYSPDLSTLGNWRGSLIIFLDVEHLFSATGLHGTFFKSLFDSFNSLVRDVNNGRGNGEIHLRYLKETESDFESFFLAAQNIVEGNSIIDPSKTAMVSICNGCSSASDVLIKRAEFKTKLAHLKIAPELEMDYYSGTNRNYNVEGSDVLENLTLELADYKAEPKEIFSILKIFTKVNVIRKGESEVGIDRVASIFLTESWLPQRIAFSNHVRESRSAIPHATNIEFLIEKLWFKLNKGFGNSSVKPISFDSVIRAKMAVSNQINKSISVVYKDLLNKCKKGEISKDTLAIALHDIYNTSSKPEDTSEESIRETDKILNDSYVEKVIKEKDQLQKDAEDGRQATQNAIALKKEVLFLKRQMRRDKILPIKILVRRQYIALRIITYLAMPSVFIFATIFLYSPLDSTLSIVFGSASVLGLVNSIFRPKKIDNFYWSLLKSRYRNKLKKL